MVTSFYTIAIIHQFSFICSWITNISGLGYAVVETRLGDEEASASTNT